MGGTTLNHPISLALPLRAAIHLGARAGQEGEGGRRLRWIRGARQSLRVRLSPGLVVAAAALLAASPRPALANVEDPSDVPVSAPPAPSAPPEPAADPRTQALERLRSWEIRLSVGQQLTETELAELDALARSAPDAPVRASAHAVLAWLMPHVAVPPLVAGTEDQNERVRFSALQGLLAVGRRAADAERTRALQAALTALDDAHDDVACVAAEVLGSLAPAEAQAAIRARADGLGAVRYGCFSRIAGLPTRPVELPARLTAPPAPPAATPSSPPDAAAAPAVLPVSPIPERDGTLLVVSTAAGAGLVSGALWVTGLVPSRDILTYRAESTSFSRQDVAFAAQASAAAVGALAAGGGAWALSRWVKPLSIDGALAVGMGTLALGLAGASAPVAFGLEGGAASFAAASGLLVGLVGTGAVAWTAGLDHDDTALAGAALGLGALTAGLGAFAAVPVGTERVGSALRVDFGLGLVGVGAGVTSFGALLAAPFLDISAERSAAALLGGALGAGLGTAAGFIFLPQSEVRSRIACAVGLGGELVGVVVALLAHPASDGAGERRGTSPRAAPAVPVGAAIEVGPGSMALGIPMLEAWPAPPGLAASPSAMALGATVVRGRF